MKVRVKLFNQLRLYAPGGQAVSAVRVASGASVGDLLRQLNIPSSVQRTTLVNGRRADVNTRLSAGDEVVLMSPIEGG